MLSRRDQALLVDLVRQSAIAIRSATLATELQVSREQLVPIARTTGGGSGVTCTTVSARRSAASRCGWMRRAMRCRPIPNAAGC